MYAELAVFVLGLLFGSFANVLILRLNTGESLIFGGSRCFFCGRNLKWFELIPVISFLVLGGKCRECGSRISWQYPLVELSSGILFFLLYAFGPNPVWSIAFFWLLLVISVYDLRHKIIPNQLVYPAISISLLVPISNFANWTNDGFVHGSAHVLSGLGLFSFFAMLWLVSSGRWMGFGDAKMALALGFFLDWPASLAGLAFSFWFGAIFGLIFVFLKKIKNLKVEIPFAPFLFLGGLVAFLWGERLISWYLSLL